MQTFLDRFERVITAVLIAVMVVLVSLATIDLAWVIIKGVLNEPAFRLDANVLLDLFGFVMLVLIGLELLETIKAYHLDHVVHSEIVVEVAIIAVVRKVIIMDFKALEPLLVIGIAALVVSLGVTFWIIKRVARTSKT